MAVVSMEMPDEMIAYARPSDKEEQLNTISYLKGVLA